MQKENIFTHKILPILSILILVSFIFINNNAFAANLEITLSDEHITNATNIANGRNFFIATNPSHCWLFICELENASFIVDNGTIKSTNGNVLFYCLPNTSSIEFVFNTTNTSAGNSTAYTYLYSSADILNTDGTVFFQRPPVTLAEILEATNPTQTFQKMMKTVVASLIVFLVGFLSFRKAWAFLKAQMKAS